MFLEVTITTLNLRCHSFLGCSMPKLPIFAMHSMALLNHVSRDAIKRLSTFASLALRTLAPVFFYSNKTCQDDFVFFSCPWHPSAFNLIESNLLGICLSTLSNLYTHTRTSSRFMLFRKLAAEKSFWRVICEKKSFFAFFKGRMVFFSIPILQCAPKWFFVLVERMPFRWPACKSYFSSKNKRFWLIWKKKRNFLISAETDLNFLVAHCVS